MLTGDTTSRWLVWPNPVKQARLRLFCFPYAGSGASIYRSWEDSLPQDVHLCCVQPPGRENRLGEVPFTRLDPLLHALLQAVEPYLDMPFAFFGHSMGALVSYELTRRLRREKNVQPVCMFMSGRGAPHLPPKHAPSRNETEESLIRRLRRARGTPKEILKNRELMQLMLPTFRADYAICDSYVHKIEEPLDCPLSVFGGEQDYKVSMEELNAWREQTCGTFRLRILPGNHFFLRQSHATLLQAIDEDLDAVAR
jgi:medium-chain acyl-[acyl-carrier-protein] hydrolase